MFPDVLAEMREIIKRDREIAVEDMSRGIAGDYASYRELVGRIKAFDFFLDEIRDLEEKYLED